MRRFANSYILLFLIDAGISVVDELLSSSASLPWLSELRHVVAAIVITLSMVIFSCLGIDRRLPKRVFLPLTLYSFWASLALWPLSGVIEREALGLLAAVNQLLLGGVAIVLLRGLVGQNLLTREQFKGPMFSWRNTLVFTIVNLLLLPFALVFSSLAMTGYYLEEQTSGFLRLSPVGIYMSERSYRLDDKVIRLAGMMHIGKEEYYQDLAASMSTEDTIILAEGVTDRDGLLQAQLNYGKLAEIIGLTSQQTMQIDGNLVDLGSLDLSGRVYRQEGKPDVALADIDLNQFDPKTIEFLNALGRALFNDKPLLEGLAEYNVWVTDNMTEQGLDGVMADILDKRNVVVIDSMLKALPLYETIIVPWGAMHMPAIESAVYEEGFTLAAERERLSLDFRAIPYAELWKKWLAQAGTPQ